MDKKYNQVPVGTIKDGDRVEENRSNISYLKEVQDILKESVAPEGQQFGDGTNVSTQATRAEDIISNEDVNLRDTIQIVADSITEPGGVNSRLEVLETENSSQQTEIETNQTDISQLQTEVQTLESDINDTIDRVDVNENNIDILLDSVGSANAHQKTDIQETISTSPVYLKPILTDRPSTDSNILEIVETNPTFTLYKNKLQNSYMTFRMSGNVIKDSGDVDIIVKASSNNTGTTYFDNTANPFSIIFDGAETTKHLTLTIPLSKQTNPVEDIFLTFTTSSGSIIIQEHLQVEIVVEGESGGITPPASDKIVDTSATLPLAGINPKLNSIATKVPKYSEVSSINKIYIYDGKIEELKWVGGDTVFTLITGSLHMLTTYKGRDLVSGATEASFPWDQAGNIQNGDTRNLTSYEKDYEQIRFETYNNGVFNIDNKYDFNRTPIEKYEKLGELSDITGEVFDTPLSASWKTFDRIIFVFEYNEKNEDINIATNSVIDFETRFIDENKVMSWNRREDNITKWGASHFYANNNISHTQGGYNRTIQKFEVWGVKD